MLVDSHCHLDLLDLEPQDDVNKVIARAKDMGVVHILNVCVAMADFPTVLEMAKRYDFVSASVGQHPNETKPVTFDELITLGQDPEVVAIGETGLDYYRSTGDVEWQRERFRTHIRAAKALKKPLIIHTRAAKADTIDIMIAEGAKDVGGVMHCFTEDWEMAKQALDLHFAISFSGIVTFKNATTIQDVAKKVPFDRLLIETDSPYLAPIPYRGKPNEPGFVRYTAEFLAQLRGVPFDVFAKSTTDNFFKLFTGAVKSYV